MNLPPRTAPTPRVLLRQLREVMAEESDAQTRLDHLVEAIARNMVADVCSIYVRRADDALELTATQGLRKDAVHQTRLAWTEGLVGLVARTGRPINLRRANQHPEFSFREETGEHDLNAFLGVPIIRSGSVIGVLTIQNQTTRAYVEDEIEASQMVATVLAEIISSERFLSEREVADVEGIVHGPEHALGTAIVPGVARGVVYLLQPQRVTRQVFSDDLAAERQKLSDGIASLQKSVDDMIAKDRALSNISRDVLEVYRLFAYDRGWARRIDEKIMAGLSAEAAVEQVQAENRTQMRKAADPYLRERMHDLDDLSRRLLKTLGGEEIEHQLPDNAIVLAETLGPAELLELDRAKLAGLVLTEASSNSHAAVVARSLRLPMVSGVGEVIDRAEPGDDIIVDGSTGEVYLRPTQQDIETFEDKARIRSEQLAKFAQRKDEPAITRDGAAVGVEMNAGLVMDLSLMDEVGAEGVGLFRTELQFLVGQTLPTVMEQTEYYRSVLDAAGNSRVVFRTADLGSDKRAGYMHGPLEANPAMGWRGLRMAIDRKGLLRTQIRALIAAADGRPLSILLPLVTTVDELIVARSIIDKEMQRVTKLEQAAPSSLEVGAMVEIPSAAWGADKLASHADFLSIGGNDLAQFFFAADRESDLVSSRYDYLSTEFLEFLKTVVDKGHSRGVRVSYCGEQAADPLMAIALIAIGCDRLSVPASAIMPLKDMVRSIDREALRAKMDTLLDPGTDEPLRDRLRAAANELSIPLYSAV
ncbi:MAG: phosphoenolpyruvate--protein phosphotransferase [Pseudomonadota bacterium]